MLYANHLDADISLERTRAGAERIRSWGSPVLTSFADQLVDHLADTCNREAPLTAGQYRQVVHGDFWDNNVLFAGGDVVAVLDFGFMAERARINDLALPIWFYLLDHPLPPQAEIRLVAAMLDAYDQNNSLPLTTAERLSLPLAIARQPAWMVGRWVLDDDEDLTQIHAREAATEFPTAARILRQLDQWQFELTK